MTNVQDQDDLERVLRSTLTAVASTATNTPRWVAPQGLGKPRAHHRLPARWAAPLAAAAVILAIAGTIALRSSHDTSRNSPTVPAIGANRTPTSQTSAANATGAPGVRLRWLSTPVPPSYTENERIVTAQFSGEQLIKKDDPQSAGGGDGGGRAGVLVRRWVPGAFDAATVTRAKRVHVGSRTALFGDAPAGLFDAQTLYAQGPVPTLAVQTGSDRWVTFAGATRLTQRQSELIRVAKIVLSSSRTTPMTVPFRLGPLPASLHVLGASDDLDPSHPYGLQIDVTDDALTGPVSTVGQTTDLHIQVWRQNTVPTSPTGRHVSIDGRTGVLDMTGDAAYFPIGARLVSIEYDGPDTTPAALQSVLAGLRWSADPTSATTWYDATGLFR
jgi:hypothetical protein